MKKSWITVCLAVAAAVATVAISISAQKKSVAQPSHKEQSDAQHAHAEATTHADCPLMQGDKPDAASDVQNNDAHLAAVNERGEHAMGFSQTATTHHFILTKDGGLIQVEVKDPNDAENLNKIRQHLAHISRAFAEGNFSTPMLVHERVPPGASVMQRLKAAINYAYEETERGARVRIKTADADALTAIHEFLRFQITDHKTGDALEASER